MWLDRAMRARLRVAVLCLAAGCGAEAPAPCPPPSPAPAPKAEATAAASSPVAEPVADPERLRAYAATRGFRLGAPDGMTPTPDGKAVVYLRSAARDPKQSLFETSMETRDVRLLLSPDDLQKGPETLSAAEKARREPTFFIATR
jgi:hypothetical protein